MCVCECGCGCDFVCQGVPAYKFAKHESARERGGVVYDKRERLISAKLREAYLTNIAINRINNFPKAFWQRNINAKTFSLNKFTEKQEKIEA